MTALDRITGNPSIMNGQPCIRGMRFTVKRVLDALATYPDRNELRSEYPELDDEDIRQALEYAAANLDDKVLVLPASIGSYCWIKDCLVRPCGNWLPAVLRPKTWVI